MMANIRFRSIEGYESFKTKCNFFRCEEEYPGWTGNEKYIIVTDVPEQELLKEYPRMLSAMRPYLIVGTDYGKMRNDSYNAERRAKFFSAKSDAFGLNDETENFHNELIDYSFSEKSTLSMELEEALNELTEIQRKRVIKYYFGRMTMEEIANSEGTVKSAVKKSLEQALAKLHKYFI